MRPFGTFEPAWPELALTWRPRERGAELMRTRLAEGIVAAALIGLVASACGGNGNGDDETPPPGTPAATATATARLPGSATPPSAPTVVPSLTPMPPLPSPTSTPTPLPGDGPSVAVRRIEGANAVFLTIDAGSDRGYAEEMLDVLASRGVHASFGVTGEWAATNPDLVRRITAEGHALLNHSYDHPSFTGASWDYVALTRADRLAQLQRAEDAYSTAAAGARGTPYFRPPFGDYDASVLADVGAGGYRYTLMWTTDSGGWRGLPVDEIVARVATAVAGDIVIMHVGSRGDFEALPRVLDGFAARGLATAAVDEYLR